MHLWIFLEYKTKQAPRKVPGGLQPRKGGEVGFSANYPTRMIMQDEYIV